MVSCAALSGAIGLENDVLSPDANKILGLSVLGINGYEFRAPHPQSDGAVGSMEHRSGEDIFHSHRRSNFGMPGPGEDFLRRPGLKHFASIHDHEAISQTQCIDPVV